jgi:UDP-3-O-[3-hydroxymyristoyl] N-acetylglucosamine deacetylase
MVPSRTLGDDRAPLRTCMASSARRGKVQHLMTPRLISDRQTTLAGSVTLQGVGAHSNIMSRVTLSPADANSGVIFLRSEDEQVEGRWSHVSASQWRTRLGRGAAAISTVEHLMAALYGMGVDNAVVDTTGLEIPAMDGSARAFVEAINETGIITLGAPRRRLMVVEPVRVSDGDSYAELLPAREGLSLDIEIDFPKSPIGRQRRRLALTRRTFVEELAGARTFGFVKDAERLWREGLALGASLENTIALTDDRILNREGLRFADEFVRHKMLDAVGDLALAGLPIVGAFRSYRCGHRLNHALVERLMTTPSASEMAGDVRHSGTETAAGRAARMAWVVRLP